MFEPPIESRATQVNLATLCEEGRDAADPELDGLLQRVVHPLAFGNAEREVDVQRRDSLRGPGRADHRCCPAPLGADQVRGIVMAVAVEQHQGRLGR